MTPKRIDRTEVMFSVQRALVGEVFPALRGVTVKWTDSMVSFTAYVDGELQERDAESLSCVSAEVAADFWEGVEIDYQVVRIDAPAPINDPNPWVFKRREY